MVKPLRWTRITHLGLACAGMLAGCSVVPRAQMDECRKLSRSLQADNARLKNMFLTQKTQYDDLAQRAEDDARRLKSQEQEIQKLLASVSAYQDEREQLARGVDLLKNQIRSATRPVSARFRSQFESFAKSQPGCEFDEKTSIVTIPSDILFEPGTNRWKPKAQAILTSFAQVLDDPDASDLRLLVTGHTDDSPIARTSLASETSEASHLSLDRATKVREILLAEGHLEAGRIDVAGVESSQPRATGPDDKARALNRRIEIQISRTGALTPEPGTDP